MPILEYDYNNKDYELVANQTDGSFGSVGDYIRLIVYESSRSGASLLSTRIATVGAANLTANPLLPQSQNQAIFYSSLSESEFDINISPFYSNTTNLTPYTIGGDKNDFKIYKSDNGGIYVKPNEIFNTFGLAQGNYKLQIDFLNQLKPSPALLADNISPEHYQFIIKQISTSRREVRLKIVDLNLNDNSVIINDIINKLNTNNAQQSFSDYQFGFILNLASGVNIPITNYTFDKITDGKDNQSIILRLYKPIPRTIVPLNQVTLEREVLITQTTNVFYFSDVGLQIEGRGLIPDEVENWINPNENESLELENYNDLTSSLSNTSLQNLLSGSDYNYPNINTDFKLFENHTFFGSAKRKLVNFKNKVETIQGHYSDISSSLSASGVAIDGDSEQLVQYRENLFNKIESEINSFTPYERFLYYDGQSESTASAPGIGKNYVDYFPVADKSDFSFTSYIGQIDGGDGLDNTIYHHSSKNLGENRTDIDLFTDKYRVENKPFFNYSSSIYLSFLMKGDDGISLTWFNGNRHQMGTRPPLPEDALYQNSISNPEITGSHYQRFIFEASQSYWVPTSRANFDFSEIECFTSNSPEIEILSGSIKTGSSAVKDTSGKYQNYTTVVTQSGIPFVGSCGAAGELFRIYYQNTLSSSLSGSWKVDDQISGSIVTDAMLTDFSGRENTGSVVSNGTIKISDGVIHPDTGRQYGKSILFVSESNDDIRFFSDKDFNYTRDDNFSLSVWAKRFHSDTGSADATNGNSQAIFTRGFSGASYGIDYDYQANQIRAGVRGNSSQVQATFNTTDDLLEWNHVVFTYESGSSTGIKLYVNGELKDSESTGDGYQVTGNSHFSASAANIGGVTDSLSIGSNDAIGGTQRYYNGFIQYPRVYNRAITQDEVTQLYNSPDGITQTKITDVKITLEDPTDVQPFSQLYHTSSADWTSWYDGIYDSASAFDTDNIHSLENNLPTYIQESNEYDELKDFLSLQGEQYDVIKNHIDSLGTLYERGYKKTNSPPENIYPMLLNSLGWEAINPFSGSLSDSLGSYLTGITSIDDIKNNTWRKTLNNLLYLYKTKGTQNSLRALMNIYGYPPDVLQIQEFGGSNQDVVDSEIISDTPPSSDETQIDTDLQKQTGSIGFINKKEKLFNYMFQGKTDRGLELDWWMDNADTNTIEFVYKHNTSTQTQTILKSSGSLSETLWDLRLVPSTDGISSSFEFRLNNSNTGSSAIADNGVSMSSDYSNMTDGQLWNVMLQRATASVSGSGTNEYRLHASLQDGATIKTYNYVTMSISGGLTNTYVTGGADSNYYANQNWSMTGSRHYLSSSNLFVGEKFSGSLSQIKAWTTTLSNSKFRKHTLNKFSILGNSITSHCKELIYHFKLNENYTTASISSSTQTLHIIDSAPKMNLRTDYSFLFEPLDIITGSCASQLYGSDVVDTIKLGLQDNNQNNNNDNNIIINPSSHIIGNLNAESTIFGVQGRQDYVTSPRLELNNSPQDIINNHILNHMDTFNFEKYYGNPKYYYSASYKELDTLREEFFDCSPILVNTNEYIRAQENILNSAVTDGIKTTVPVRSTLSDANTNIGVTIKPTILEKQKYEREEYSVETNPNSPSGSLSFVSTGSYQHNFVLSSLLELPYSSSLSMGSAYVSESVDGRFITPQFLQPGGYTASLESEKTGSISPLPEFTGSLELPYSSSLSMGSTFVSESDDNRNVVPPFVQQGGVTASIEFPKSGSIEEITTQYTKEFVNIHDSWGTHESSSHFMNYANKVKNTYQKSKLDLRFANSASADSTITLTSIEAGDYVNTGSTSPNLDELTFKTRTYLFVSHSGTANLDYNGALSTDSSSVHVLTGSNSSTLGISGSQANNLKAAISSSNGHGDSFGLRNEAAQLKHRVFLTNRVAGPIGNTLSASFNTSMELSLIDGTASPLPFRGGSIGLGDYDDGHIEPRYTFRMVGDTEHYSGSYDNSDNFSCAGNFYNREQVTENLQSHIQYESLLTGNPGLQDGRMLGKTRYFYTGSDGNIILPSNHIDKFSNPFKDKMWEGAQNVSPGFLDTQYEDYATSSFYRVKVTGGENQITVRKPNPKIDSDDRITY